MELALFEDNFGFYVFKFQLRYFFYDRRINLFSLCFNLSVHNKGCDYSIEVRKMLTGVLNI